MYCDKKGKFISDCGFAYYYVLSAEMLLLSQIMKLKLGYIEQGSHHGKKISPKISGIVRPNKDVHTAGVAR